MCFALGIGAGWLTAQIPGWYRAWSEPEPSVSATPSATPDPDVSVPALDPITRDLDADDAAAGVTTLTVPDRGEGTFTAIPTTGAEPSATASSEATATPTRYVRIDVEDGLAVDTDALRDFVMGTLNDPRGWGSAGRLQFIQTEGAADVRIVLASPYTVALNCPDPHAAAAAGGASPAPSPSGDDEQAQVACATQGIVPVSLQDWTAGLERYGDRRAESRQFLLNHGVGHVLGEADVTCSSGYAPVMVDQAAMGKECKVNAWPYPDAAAS